MKARDRITSILESLERKNLDEIASREGVAKAIMQREELIKEGVELIQSYRKIDLNR